MPPSRRATPANGTPPLIFHGGPVMMTPSTSPLVITPIFWAPSGHTMSSAYTSLITTYLSDVAAASGQNTNVFSVANEYSGSNGQIHYNVSVGTAVNDINALPASGCRVASSDRSRIYADDTGVLDGDGPPQVVPRVGVVVHLQQGPAAAPDLILQGEPQLILALLGGRLTAAEAAGRGLQISGDTGVLHRVLPEPAVAP